jgi:ribosomal-protein-alanine N-acetyltransferase
MPLLTSPVLPAGSWGGSAQPQIEGDGLLLRPWRTGDESFLLEAYADPEIQRWHTFTLADPAEAGELIARRAAGWKGERSADWSVAEGGDLLGRIGFRVIDLDEGEAEIAYWVSPQARRRGVATRSVRVLIDWARANGLHRVTLQHSTRNEASCRVAQHCGFALEGTAVRAVRHTDGWHDMHLHALLLE